eukprot:6212624-Pleurochrysis_carterae.AAC.4
MYNYSSKLCPLAFQWWVNVCTFHILVARQERINQGNLGAVAPPGGALAARPADDVIGQKSLPFVNRNWYQGISVMKSTVIGASHDTRSVLDASIVVERRCSGNLRGKLEKSIIHLARAKFQSKLKQT